MGGREVNDVFFTDCHVPAERLLGQQDQAWMQLMAGLNHERLIIAAQAMGYGANWITDWYAYDEAAGRLLGLESSERVAGFVHLGTPSEAPLERVRPDMAAVVSRWRPPAP